MKMNLSEFKDALAGMDRLRFVLPDGTEVPSHFHITEVGLITRSFIDCGGTVREEKTINLQLWVANDFDHQLAPQKLVNIIRLSERKIGLPDAIVEVEYQQGTIGKFHVILQGDAFRLLPTQTACLAMDACGVPSLAAFETVGSSSNSCTPGGGCC